MLFQLRVINNSLLSQDTEKTIPCSVQLTVDDVVKIWSKTGIPTALRYYTKDESLVDEYNLLKKNKSKVSAPQAIKRHHIKQDRCTGYSTKGCTEDN